MTTRQELIDASIDLFALDGFEGTSLAAIAERAGVTQPTLNYHFGTKVSLYRDVIRHCGAQWVGATVVGDELRDLAPIDLLKVVLRRLGRVIIGQEVVTRLMLQASMHRQFEADVEEAVQPGVDALSALMEQLTEEGVVRPLPPYVPISMFADVLIMRVGLARIQSAVYQEDFSDEVVLENYIDHLIDVLINGALSRSD